MTIRRKFIVGLHCPKSPNDWDCSGGDDCLRPMPELWPVAFGKGRPMRDSRNPRGAGIMADFDDLAITTTLADDAEVVIQQAGALPPVRMDGAAMRTAFKGDQGDQGSTGVQGNVGSQGQQGNTGAQGNLGNPARPGLPATMAPTALTAPRAYRVCTRSRFTATYWRPRRPLLLWVAPLL